MSWFHRLRNVVRSDRLSRDIDREMAFHLEERTDALRALGVPADAAVREARRRFGNPTLQRERTRDADVAAWFDALAADIRYAVRALRHSPAFAFVAVASLALGIGANTAIYSLIDAVVLAPLPVPHPDELLQVTMGKSSSASYFTNPLWEQVRDRQGAFQSVAAFGEDELNTAPGGEARRIGASYVSGDYFRVFDVQPAAGRLFTRADDVRGCAGIAVLGYGYWQREFGARSDVVGRTMLLEGKAFAIVGVVADGFRGAEVGRDNAVYVPLCSLAVIRGNANTLDSRSAWWLRIIGRRAAGLTDEQAAARVTAMAPAAYAATVPPNWSTENQRDYLSRTLGVTPARNGMPTLRSRYGVALALLMGAVGLVLLIACANVANLLLVRAARRQHEVAIRLAIGAARGRLVRQLLTESALLAVSGAVMGLLVAHWATQALVALISTRDNPVTLDLAINLRVLAFTALASAVTIVVFGLVPAWRGTSVSPQAAMKSGGRGVMEGHARFTLGKALVVGQMALSLVLLVGAGLLVQSLRNLTRLDPGFEPAGVLIVDVDLRRAGLSGEEAVRTQRDLLERVRTLPGVTSAALTQVTPIGNSTWNDVVLVDGFTPASMDDAAPWFNEVSEGYFALMHTRLLAGRDFNANDVPGAGRTAIVNVAMARRFYGSDAPLGKTFRIKGGRDVSEPYTIVGVVENAKYRSLREPASPIVYVPETQNLAPGPVATLLIRGTGRPGVLVETVKRAVPERWPAAIMEFHSLPDQLAASLVRERMLAVLSALFGAVALVLSLLGLYGVMAYAVARRRSELGVRMALGAARPAVLRLVLGDVARVVALGVALGVVGATAAGRLVTGLLYGLAPADPRVMLLATALLAVVAFGAGFVPAWRASGVDPMGVLREE